MPEAARAVSQIDPVAFIDTLVSEITSNGPFIPAQAARDLAERLRAEHPRITHRWLDLHLENLLRRQITDRIGYDRIQARRRAMGGAFTDAAKAFEAGDPEPIGLFRTLHQVDLENTQMQLADMTGVEHGFLACTYEETASTSLMLAAFHRALQRKCGKRRTKDVMTEEECERLLQSITRRPT